MVPETGRGDPDVIAAAAHQHSLHADMSDIVIGTEHAADTFDDDIFLLIGAAEIGGIDGGVHIAKIGNRTDTVAVDPQFGIGQRVTRADRHIARSPVDFEIDRSSFLHLELGGCEMNQSQHNRHHYCNTVVFSHQQASLTSFSYLFYYNKF